MEYLLALDIGEDCVSGVLLELGQKATVVRSHGMAPLAGSTLVDAVREVVRQIGYTRGECRVSLSTAGCSFRNLRLPFRDGRKIAKVLPFELEETTAFSVDELCLDYFPLPGEGAETELLVAMVEKVAMREVLEQLQEAGIDPDIVSVAGVPTAMALAAMSTANHHCILLDIGLRQTTLVVVDNGRVVLVRPLGIDAGSLGGYSLSQQQGRVIAAQPENIGTIVDRILQPLRQTLISIGRQEYLDKGGLCFVNGPVGLDGAMFEQLRRKLPMEVAPCNISKRMHLKIEPVADRDWHPAYHNAPLAMGLWQRKDGPLYNFRNGDFRKRRSFKEVKKKVVVAAACLGVACCGIIGFLTWDYGNLSDQKEYLDKEIRTVFQQTLPDVTRIVDPLQQLKVRIDEGRRVYGDNRGGGGLSKLMILAELSRMIPESLPVRITRLVSDQNDLRIMAETSDFNTVDSVKRELEKSSLFQGVVISSANLAPKGGGVRFELRVQFR